MWQTIQAAARERAQASPLLAPRLEAMVLAHPTLGAAVAYILAERLADRWIEPQGLQTALEGAFSSAEKIEGLLEADLAAVKDRDPACADLLTPLVYFRGFQMLQAHRAAHFFWTSGGESELALFLQSRIADVFCADIHPGARIGGGAKLGSADGVVSDHTLGLVIGETAVIGPGTTILHGVTLGGRGDEGFDRHPKIGRDVFIGAHAQILGNIEIGDGAQIGAGAVVLTPVPAGHTAVGAPATVKPPRSHRTRKSTSEPVYPPAR